MIELTTGYVAGIIAAAIVFAKLICPTVLSFILAGILRDEETAGTWTSVARALHRSHWPAILRSDPYRDRGVRMVVRLITYLFPLISILIAIAGVVTPLGLYEKDELADSSVSGIFKYVGDNGSFAAGTSPRDDKAFSRHCFWEFCPAPCPYINGTVVWESGDLEGSCNVDKEVNTTVPYQVHEIYSSGTRYSRTTVSNFFDIQWRQLTRRYDREYDKGKPYAVGTYRQLESFALGGQIRAVEGLVVDGRHGSIGFRNHTIPCGHTLGSEWSEDLLFLEPVSECVDSNLTIDFRISTSRGEDKTIDVTDLVLTDRGGFADFVTANPLNSSQPNESNEPDLKNRAYQAAWSSNLLTMWYLNISVPPIKSVDGRGLETIDSYSGKNFSLSTDAVPEGTWKSVDVSELGVHLKLPVMANDTYDSENYPNPWGIVSRNFTDIESFCQGVSRRTRPAINSTLVTCNQVRGTPRRVDGRLNNLFEDKSSWSAPLYTCASSVKATIKSVTFHHNSTTNDLSNLRVKSIRDKQYSEDDKVPLWGFEEWDYPLSGLQPVWGLVDDAYEGFPNVTTVRAPSLFMIGSGADKLGLDKRVTKDQTYMNMPGAIAPHICLNSITREGLFADGAVNYLAEDSMSLWLRWRELSGSVKDVPQMLKLMWTDLAASAMTGSKGTLGEGNAHLDRAADIQILPVVHRVKYHTRFAIPAFVLALVILSIGLVAAASMLFGKSSLKVMNHRLKQTSLGRVITTLHYQGMSSFQMPVSQWTEHNASKLLNMVDRPQEPWYDPTDQLAAANGNTGGGSKRPNMGQTTTESDSNSAVQR